MLKKRLLSLVPLLVGAALALSVGASSAGAAACTGTNIHVLCTANEPLRDDLVEPPEGVSGGGFGASILGTNLLGPLRLTDGELFNENPATYAYFGVKLHSNPLAPPGANTEECKQGFGEAEGWVTFVDIQNAKNAKAEASPVFDNTSPGYNGPWPIGIKSDKCKNNPGQVKIERVALFFEKLAGAPVVVAGTILGKYSQPAALKCPAGGIELTKVQKALTVNGAAAELEISNGVKKEVAFICFVSANNYLFPEKEVKWVPLVGEVKKN